MYASIKRLSSHFLKDHLVLQIINWSSMRKCTDFPWENLFRRYSSLLQDNPMVFYEENFRSLMRRPSCLLWGDFHFLYKSSTQENTVVLMWETYSDFTVFWSSNATGLGIRWEDLCCSWRISSSLQREYPVLYDPFHYPLVFKKLCLWQDFLVIVEKVILTSKRFCS